jgi:hypothetical protein
MLRLSQTRGLPCSLHRDPDGNLDKLILSRRSRDRSHADRRSDSLIRSRPVVHRVVEKGYLSRTRFFAQAGWGYGKWPFRILKFRTMVQGAEKLMSQVEYLNETQGPTFKLTNGPRITPVGNFYGKQVSMHVLNSLMFW